MTLRLAVVLGFVVALLVWPVVSCSAQAGDGPLVLQLDPSIRAAGMGHASGAVFWGLDCNHWANPALLGYERGVRFEHGRTWLTSPWVDDAFCFKTDRITIGARGVGLFLSGFPVDGVGRTRFDFGESMATDEAGYGIGTFRSWEDKRSVGIGVSLSAWQLSRSAAGSGLATRLARAGDVAFGLTCNRVIVNLAPSWATPSGAAGTGKGTGLDGGVLLRLTPYDSIDSLGWFPPVDGRLDPLFGGLRFDASAGSSYLSFTDSKVNYGRDRSDPMPRRDRLSAAARLATGFPGIGGAWLRDRGLDLVVRSLTPLIQFGAAWDRTKGTPDEDPVYAYNRGWELTVANVYSIRRGHDDYRVGNRRGNTSGWGLGFRLGGYAGFRYDEDTTPRNRIRSETGWHEALHQSWTVQVDPLAIWREVRP
jgi:hypothetical protein